MTLELYALLERARAFEGRSVEEIAALARAGAPSGGRSTKGKVGELLERVLGATGGSGERVVDFPSLGLELKSIPITEQGKVLESTFVCAVRVDEEVDFDASWVRKKLTRVLFVPIVGQRGSPLPSRRVGAAVLWEPSAAQLAELRADYDDIMGLIGIGRMEDVSGHLGKYLQLRPKARDGSPRAVAFGREGERIRTVPRGFYLRPKLTEALLRDPLAMP
ncbi:MAG: DNA mismatch repair protein MutH [Polyangiaceae bacterium]|nr:DNA mismatch repair protein MutH [Polyangiaceae bacterium]